MESDARATTVVSLTAADTSNAAPIRVCIISGRRLIRVVLTEFLAKRGIAVYGNVLDCGDLAALLRQGGERRCDAVILAIAGMDGCSYAIVRDTLELTGMVPLVVLADSANRGDVYTALRAGAKAFASSNSEPEELIRAIEMASQGRVYLAPDVAELVVHDISVAAMSGGKPKLPTDCKLSVREMEIIQMLCEGLSSKAIARGLHISLRTVENHRHNIYLKCQVDNIASLFRYAIRNAVVAI